MKLKEVIKKADAIFVSVHMSEGVNHAVKISKKTAKEISKDYLDCEFYHDNVENDQGSIIAYCDIPRLNRGYYTALYLGR